VGTSADNNKRYGLAAGIVTKNLDIASNISRFIRAGIIWINCFFAFGNDIPYGGYKMSGFGRDFGLEYIVSKFICCAILYISLFICLVLMGSVLL